MASEVRYGLNRDEIVAKVLDGEAIMINLAKGIYYSLDGAGGRIWELLEDGRSADEIAAVIAFEFDVIAERAQVDVSCILREMQAEGILRAAASSEPPPSEVPSCVQLHGKQSYRKPKLTVYRDMADLLALEPPTPGTDQEELWQGFEKKAGG